MILYALRALGTNSYLSYYAEDGYGPDWETIQKPCVQSLLIFTEPEAAKKMAEKLSSIPTKVVEVVKLCETERQTEDF
jgi:hypothetical protein